MRFHLEWRDEVEELGARGEYLRYCLSQTESSCLHGDMKDAWELFRRREDGFELSFFTFTEVN